MLGKADWCASSPVAANFGLFDKLFAFNSNKYQNPRSDIKVLAAFTSDDDIYLSGRKGANNASQLKGAIMAVSGIREQSGTQITAVNEEIFTRIATKRCGILWRTPYLRVLWAYGYSCPLATAIEKWH